MKAKEKVHSVLKVQLCLVLNSWTWVGLPTDRPILLFRWWGKFIVFIIFYQKKDHCIKYDFQLSDKTSSDLGDTGWILNSLHKPGKRIIPGSNRQQFSILNQC